jgi:hypothetical protein
MKITRNGDTGESSPKAAPADGIPLSEVDPGPLKVLRNGETGEPMSRKKPAEGIPLSKKPAGRPKILRNGDTGETPAKTVPADGLELPASSERLASEAQGAKLSREEQLAGIRKRSEVEDVREKTPSKPARTAARARTDVGTVEVGQPDPAFPGSKVEAVEIDHVYPLDKMYKLKGAAQLSREDLIILGNTPENLVPVSRKVNGSRRNLSYREWSQTNEIGRSADPEYISSMITLEEEMEALLQERVNTLLRARMQAEMTPELRNGIANGIDLN